MSEMLLAKEGIPAQVVEFAQGGVLTPRDRRLTG